ncbi:MAG: thymidylate kinase-like protein, partial [Gemmatimonadetes bacterium]|nr:thymidylate kinase-like protein [Gemmatimonadota bacterium]
VGRSRRERAPVVDPHGRPPRGRVVSVVKLGWWWIDYWLGYLLEIRPALRRSTLVLFDRYFDDVVVDPARYRYGASARLARVVGRSVPRPDSLVVLDAPVDVLRSRKQEVTPMEMERQRKAYLRLAGRLGSARVVDASRPIEAVVDEVARIVMEFAPGGRS